MRLARSFVSGSALAVVLFASAAARAATVTETEVDGAATNNSQATAEVIAGTSFTTGADPNVFGSNGTNGTITGLTTASISGRGDSNDVDYFQFTLTSAAANIWFDIDGASGFDTQIFLFDAAGGLIAFNDDYNVLDPGSTSNLDSFLGDLQALAAGTYFIAVSEFNNDPTTGAGPGPVLPDNPNNTFTDRGTLVGSGPGQSFLVSGTQGGAVYTLHITTNGGLSGPLVVPEPGTWALFGLGAAGLLGAAWRRRRRPVAV